MSLSRVIKVGDGSTTQFTVNFALGFLSRDDVTVRVGNEVDGAGNPAYRTITWLSDTLLEVSGPPAGVGIKVAFDRATDRDTLAVDFENGDEFSEDNLNTAQKQALMLAHEALDGKIDILIQDLNFGTFRAVNVGEPVEATDAATKGYVDTSVGTLNLIAGDITDLAAIKDELVTLHDNIPLLDAVDDNKVDISTVADNIVDVKNFAAVYIGPKALPPTLRNNGTPLSAGDLYFDTSMQEMRVYTGSEWKNSSAQALNMVANSFTGTGATTVFTLGAAPGVAANVLVWQDGVRQRPLVDYTVSGTQITFVAAPSNGAAIDTIVVATISTIGVPANKAVTDATLSDPLALSISKTCYTRAELASLDTTRFKFAYLAEGTRAGAFMFTTGDLSSKVTLDTLQGVYVAPASASSGASGAWVRVRDSANVWNPMWFGAKADMATNDLPVFQCIHNLAGARDVILMPHGFCAINGTWVVTKALSLIGLNKYVSGFYGIGFTQDTSLVDYQGTTGNRLQNIKIDSVAFRSDNNLARGLSLTWVNKSMIRNVYLYNVYNGIVGNNAWGNNWENLSVFGITASTLTLQDECNNNVFNRCEFSGHRGVHITGGLAALVFLNCDFEGIVKNGATLGAGIRIAPPTGKIVRSVKIVGGYWENIAGYAFESSPIDAGAVQGVSIHGAYFYGNNAYAQYAILPSNVNGIDIDSNKFESWTGAAIAYQTTTTNGRVANNVCDTGTVPALTNNVNQLGPSVELINNTYGRKVEYRAAVPTTGSYTRGDIVYNTSPSIDANNLTLFGWTRLTTGSAHVLGTDWGRMYIKHTTP